MYEHAYHIDFGSNAQAYVAAFMRNIDWSAVEGRYEDATKVLPPRPLEQKQFADVPAISVEEVQAMIDSRKPVQIIDARPRHYTTRAHEIMDGAVWRDPERIDDWIGEIAKDVAGRHLLRLRLPYRLPDRDRAARSGLRRALHGGRPLRLEGGGREGAAARGMTGKEHEPE